MLVRLLYASRAVDPSPDVIEDILAQSRQFNPSCGITGILCYGGGIFLQALEGGRMAVSDLVLAMPGRWEITLALALPGERDEAVRVLLRAAEVARTLEERRDAYTRAFALAREHRIEDDSVA